MKTTVSETATVRPDHFMVGTDGGLYDTRANGWAGRPPLRPRFAWHGSRLETLADVKAALRAGPYAWPGGYPLYFIMADGAAVSFAGIIREWRNVAADTMAGALSCWQPVALEVNYETPGLFCDITGELIPAAYLEDDENETLTENGDIYIAPWRFSLPDETTNG